MSHFSELLYRTWQLLGKFLRSPSPARLLRCAGRWVEMALEAWAVAIAEWQQSSIWWFSCFRPDPCSPVLTAVPLPLGFTWERWCELLNALKTRYLQTTWGDIVCSTVAVFNLPSGRKTHHWEIVKGKRISFVCVSMQEANSWTA